jgi:hypothetical protein
MAWFGIIRQAVLRQREKSLCKLPSLRLDWKSTIKQRAALRRKGVSSGSLLSKTREGKGVTIFPRLFQVIGSKFEKICFYIFHK